MSDGPSLNHDQKNITTVALEIDTQHGWVSRRFRVEVFYGGVFLLLRTASANWINIDHVLVASFPATLSHSCPIVLVPLDNKSTRYSQENLTVH